MEEKEEKDCPKALIGSSRKRIHLTNEKIKGSWLYIDFLYKIENEPFYPELKSQRQKKSGGEKIDSQSDDLAAIRPDP